MPLFTRARQSLVKLDANLLRFENLADRLRNALQVSLVFLHQPGRVRAIFVCINEGLRHLVDHATFLHVILQVAIVVIDIFEAVFEQAGWLDGRAGDEGQAGDERWAGDEDWAGDEGQAGDEAQNGVLSHFFPSAMDLYSLFLWPDPSKASPAPDFAVAAASSSTASVNVSVPVVSSTPAHHLTTTTSVVNQGGSNGQTGAVTSPSPSASAGADNNAAIGSFRVSGAVATLLGWRRGLDS
ncbi:hypothetical protein K435DRAFT_804303 [Dendrothele bispora CBS 962.96]|uniref:Uncharacterized protein n=1 Tax=Dendrothele bispora (strain CBS 962.96) TaxID=1314807 RepID=A0A4S8LER6_DENBC|nr:hypothetical protein K435DRAFT_804303 [Dendrothele bispora CBS 962.96]